MTAVVRQSHSWYAQGDPNNPRSDPDYLDDVGNLLLGNFRERVRVQVELGGDPWSAHESVECFRRLGLLVDGERGSGGYMLTGWKRPPRWTRLDSVYRSYMEPSLPLDVES